MSFTTKLLIITIASLVKVTFSFFGSFMNYNDIPSLVPVNTTITASSHYNLVTYLAVNLSSIAYFQIDFTNCQISAANGPLTCSYTYLNVTNSITSNTKLI